MLWTPNTPSSTRHPTKCPPSRLPSLSRLPSSRPPQLCFQHETGSKVLLVCMIHKGWNGDGITQLMLAPTMYPNANEDETHKYTNHLPPSRVVCPIQSPDSSSFWPASFYPTISGSHCYCHSILPIFFLFLVKSFSVLFFFFCITSASGHMHGSMRKGLRAEMSKHHDISDRPGWWLMHESRCTSPASLIGLPGTEFRK